MPSRLSVVIRAQRALRTLPGARAVPARSALAAWGRVWRDHPPARRRRYGRVHHRDHKDHKDGLTRQCQSAAVLCDRCGEICAFRGHGKAEAEDTCLYTRNARVRARARARTSERTVFPVLLLLLLSSPGSGAKQVPRRTGEGGR